MLKINPRFMYDEKNKKIGVILKPKDFEKILDELEDCLDLEYLKKHGGEKHKTITFEEVMAELENKK